MKNFDSLLEITIENEPFNRKKFLQYTGKGLLGAALLDGLVTNTVYAQNQIKEEGPDKAIHPDSDKPIELKPLNDNTELEDAPVFTPINPQKRIGYAIVGLGNLSLKQILPAFGASKYCKPVALVSGNAEKAKKVADQYGIPQKNIYNYQNFDEIKNNKEIDVVFIVLPNNMHLEFTLRAAKAGKHILCEKPMAATSTEAQTMVDACKKANVKLMIAYRIQYEPNNIKIKEWFRNKEYGQVKIFEGFNGQHSGDPTQWRLKKAFAGGALMDVGIYCLNTIRFLSGEEPISISGTTYSTPGDDRFKEIDETTLFTMRFPSGLVANCGCTLGAHESRRYRCYADKGGWMGMDPAFPYKGLKMEVAQAKGKQEWKSNPTLAEKDHFASEMDHFSQCIAENIEPYTPGEEGVQDMKLMEAIFESAKTGKEIKLPKIDKLDAFRGPVPKEN